MIIDCISDLHGFYPKLEGGDLLILAGDYTSQNKVFEWCEFFNWLKSQPYRKKVLIAGNHDAFFESGFPKNQKEADELKEVQSFLIEMGKAEKEDFEYLCDSGTEFEGLKIWGSPWTTTFPGINPHCCAFTVANDMELYEKWKLIPDDIDILITHNPSFGNFDITKQGESVGSITLWMRILEIMPKVHICGHIHESYGYAVHYNGIHLINCSYVNEKYQPVNKPIRIELADKKLKIGKTYDN